jgi:hypothetical protein
LTDEMEKSCLVLGFYLASWGMMRGSSFLLKEKSVKHFEKAIAYIASKDRSVWKIDVDNYDDTKIDEILNVYNNLKDALECQKHSHLVLVTKTMLGVFGFVPAFDEFFAKTFREIDGECRFRSFNKKALLSIQSFYCKNKTVVDEIHSKTFTIDFSTAEKSQLHYSKAKIIDMYGFQRGITND